MLRLLSNPPAVGGGRGPDAGGPADLADEVWIPDRAAVAEGARAQPGKSVCPGTARKLCSDLAPEMSPQSKITYGAALSVGPCPRSSARVYCKRGACSGRRFVGFMMSGSQR
ncbi:hypothetical protein GCM10010284_26810 [Streptomyces rubiginosohelvolus]|uniref:Uncharacterized protein n=1 Tax=Streptomyces rubiginosohelvolus TaxID=67362 RepID=A0ABQ3C453_9ACTN|nr:hypothetical protein GCM10010284_26810 [Streptomyces rubiginosohelvolus]GGZ67227.1 hypothetical protein GCM10010328_47920 [Streptomyces pluricolorescens]